MTRDELLAVQQFRTRLGLLYLLKFGLVALTVWAFVYGTAVLALRGALGLDRLDLLWGFLSLPLALVPAAHLAYRRLPTPVAVRALLDRHGQLGGLLMTGAERPLGEWEASLPAV